MPETPTAPSTPPPSPAPPSGAPPAGAPAPDPRGSLGLGVVIAWACLIGGYFVVGVIASAAFSVFGGGSDFAVIVALLACLAPWIAMLVFAIRFAQHGKPRTAMGIGVGFASIIGVLLLLVAACFGILSGTNFH